jgi:hypothetical protein
VRARMTEAVQLATGWKKRQKFCAGNWLTIRPCMPNTRPSRHRWRRWNGAMPTSSHGRPNVPPDRIRRPAEAGAAEKAALERAARAEGQVETLKNQPRLRRGLQTRRAPH